MLIPRYYQDIEKWLKPNKVLVIYGPRRVGKTTLVKEFLKKTRLKHLFTSGEFISTQEVISSQDLDRIKSFIGKNKLLVIDEAQKIQNVGLGLKIIVDHIEGIRVIATGSSSFDLSGQVGEPLVGRKNTLILYPLAQSELADMYTPFELERKLPEWLIFGAYPEVITANSRTEKITVLEEIVNGYLFKDILALEKVKGSKILLDLLRLLSWQIGGEVSLSELASKLAIDYKTVGRYLDLLEKTFIIVRLWGYSRNLRHEISSKAKYYFWDNGIRNAVISMYNDLEVRDDIGKIWENFLVAERLKHQEYKRIYANNYFWRTWEGQEVDWVEEREGKLFGFEFKWGKSKAKKPALWQKTYQNANFQTVNRDNYMAFIT